MAASNIPVSKKKMPFTAEEDENLIEQVRQYENLYNSSTMLYKDPERTQKSWISIANTMQDRSWREVKDRWKYLRDNFAKHKKSMDGRSGEPAAKRPYKYWEPMSFLHEHIKHRETESNLTINQSDQSESTMPMHDREACIKTESESETMMGGSGDDDGADFGPHEFICGGVEGGEAGQFRPSCSFNSISYVTPPNMPKQGAQHSDVDEAILSFLKRRSSAQPKEEDGEALFGKMVAVSIRKLSRRNASLAKLKIQQVLLEMEDKEESEVRANTKLLKYL